MGKRIIIGGIAGLAILCVCGAVGIFVFGGFFNAADVGGFFNAADGGTGEVAISVSAPLNAGVGDAVTVEIVIKNPTDQIMDLDSVDINLEYLDGVDISESSPVYSDNYSLEPLFPQMSFTFHQPIPANGILRVRMFGTAVKSGDFSGTLDVCIDGGGNCTGTEVRTIISP